jgi:hypothetical protein
LEVKENCKRLMHSISSEMPIDFSIKESNEESKESDNLK